jgi:hypothetical protein
MFYLKLFHYPNTYIVGDYLLVITYWLSLIGYHLSIFHFIMDLDELNKQMLAFQNDYSQSLSSIQPPSINDINFPPPRNTPLETTQIKRPSKTQGNYRNDINDKLTMMNMNQPNIPTPKQFMHALQTTPSNHNQMTRNNSNYYSQNYTTLQGDHQPTQFDMQSHMQMQTQMPRTHDSGVAFVNPTNFYNNQTAPSKPIHDNGFHRVDEKRIDYRQNMNTKVGGFIFDNPNASNFNPVINQFQPNRDTRMVIQDSSKDYYRQEANSRMSQYSPLSRASNVPITIANMSVNDFYSSMPNSSQIKENFMNAEEDAKAVLNSRLSSYAPLAKTTQYQPQQSTPQQQQIYQKPKTWIENNVNRENPLVAHDELPIISH